MKFQLITTFDAFFTNGEPPKLTPALKEKVRLAVKEALGNMLADTQNQGFHHSMDKEISLLLDSELVVTPA